MENTVANRVDPLVTRVRGGVHVRVRGTTSRWWCRMRQVLIVANQTVGSEALAEAVRTRMAAGPCQFVLLVPATERTDYSSAATALGGAEAGMVWSRRP